MGFWSTVGKVIDKYDELSGNKRIREQEERKNARDYKNHSVSCKKCGELAGPLPGTARNYRCSCGHQFAGPNHPY